MTNDQNREARIRERAHRRWEDEGRPEGRHEDHWHDAAREVDGEPPVPAVPAAPDPGLTPIPTDTAPAKRTRKPKSDEAAPVKRPRATKAKTPD